MRLEALYTPVAGAPVASHTDLTLVRPPLVLMHGLWSNSETWKLPLASDSRFPVIEIADYSEANAAPFSTNANRPPTAVLSALERTRHAGIAATQVDYIGHSMGGLLGRIWTTDPRFTRNENYDSGEFRKLLTFDSPHWGSPAANLLVALRSAPSGPLLATLLGFAGMPITGGAIDDLARGSAAISGIQACPVPTHGLVGTGGSDVLAATPGTIGDLYRIVGFFQNVSGTELFDGLQHDAVVGRVSQEGGLPTAATSAFPGFDGLHTSNTGSALYSQRAIELLDVAVGTPEFGLLPAPSLFTVPVTLTSTTADAAGGGVGLTITSPAPGTVVNPGQSLTVTVVANSGITVDEVLLAGRGVSATDASAPFALAIEIPEEAIGPYSLMAAGKNGLGEYYSSNTLNVTVQPTAALQLLTIKPAAPILFGAGDTLKLRILGTYSDGVSRDLTALVPTYQSLAPQVVTVSASGLVTALTLGTATIQAQYSSLNAMARVLVTAAINPDLFRDGFESGDTDVWSAAAPE